MTSSTGQGWAQLRNQARSLETQTESLFNTYSQYARSSTLPPKPTEEELRTESEIKELLSQREALISQLSLLLTSTPHLDSSALKQSNLTRHRDLLTQSTANLRTLKSEISTARDRANLLHTVRSDISAYHASNPEAAEEEYMLEERGRLDRSHGVMDSVLSQAYAVNESFGLQRETLASVQRRITGAAGMVPGVNGLIGRIGSKRRRDGLILGGFIGVCMLLLILFR